MVNVKKKAFGQHELVDPPGVSDYFRGRKGSERSKQYVQLHIHLDRAKLRNVTRFDLKRNKGFTGRIKAGNITALMGGSGCGKSSLLETIHGRRQLHENGYITFAEHEPLSNLLTDYIGYVPQADIMHNDLTVFETVYYSARARRLNESKTVIINDVCFVLGKLGLSGMHNSMTKTLSGGKANQC
jgi:ABC-type multidrug transport system ATPase subunit